MTTIDDMVDGYRDAGDPDAPDPGPNRSESYRHGFANRRMTRLKSRERRRR